MKDNIYMVISFAETLVMRDGLKRRLTIKCIDVYGKVKATPTPFPFRRRVWCVRQKEVEWREPGGQEEQEVLGGLCLVQRKSVKL